MKLFKDIQFPDNSSLFIRDFQRLEVDDNVNIHFIVNEGEKMGFQFYVTEFASCSAHLPKGESYFTMDDLEVDCLFWGHVYMDDLEVNCLFWGHVYWDGLRHLCMGDEQTDNENYLYCVGFGDLSLVFEKLSSLADTHCKEQ